MRELQQASRRQYAQFPCEGATALTVALPHYVGLRALARLFALRADAHIALGQAAAAEEDMRVLQRLAESLAGHPMLVGGQPLHYRPTADGRFQLYSIGWNEKDDNGTGIESAENAALPDLAEGDWVWPWPKNYAE